MKIVDLKVTVIDRIFKVIRVDTDEGIHGYGEASPLPKQHILDLKPFILGQDPTNVERVMMRIRFRGGFKPWGASVSAIEMALWDIAGKAAGLPIYKLIGGKTRDKVRVYCDSGSGVPLEPEDPASAYSPEA